MMPDTQTLYIYCDICANKYHPQCFGFNVSISDTTEIENLPAQNVENEL